MLDFVLSFMLILIHEYCSFVALQELQCQQEVLMNNILAQQEFRVFKERCLLSFQLHMPDPVLPNQWYCLDDYPSPPLSIIGCTLELSNTAEASRKKMQYSFSSRWQSGAYWLPGLQNWWKNQVGEFGHLSEWVKKKKIIITACFTCCHCSKIVILSM